jgi:hypothetical protein
VTLGIPMDEDYEDKANKYYKNSYGGKLAIGSRRMQKKA